jgi:ABC-type uncharacterized transport system permease subunit
MIFMELSHNLTDFLLCKWGIKWIISYFYGSMWGIFGCQTLFQPSAVITTILLINSIYYNIFYYLILPKALLPRLSPSL